MEELNENLMSDFPGSENNILIFFLEVSLMAIIMAATAIQSSK
jgi:hypothetical protein